MLAGRLPRADRPGEIALDQNGAALLHLHVGSTLPMVALPDLPPGTKPSAARTRRLTERVVGIVVTPSSVDPVTDIDKVPLILATPALWRRCSRPRCSRATRHGPRARSSSAPRP